MIEEFEWNGEVCPEQLDGIERTFEEGGWPSVESNGYKISLKSFNILSQAVLNPEDVESYIEENHPRFYEMAPFHDEWPDAYRVDWEAEERDEDGDGIRFHAVLKVAQTVRMEFDTVAERAGDMLSAFFEIVNQNPETLGIEAEKKAPKALDLTVFRAEDGIPLLVSDEEWNRSKSQDAMEW